MEKHSVGQTIATLRKRQGWTQIELAEKLQVSDKAVSKWENDASYPSIEFLPRLASLFRVSIDYIITGQPKHPQILIDTSSQLEYCAKTDDPELAQKFDLSKTDELGNTLIDYIIKYQSTRVFSALCDRDDFRFVSEKNSINELYKLAFITNKTNVLERYNFKKHKYVSDQKAFPGLRQSGWFSVTDELLDVIALDDRIDGNTISYLLSYSYDGQDFNYITWCGTLSHFLHRCYLHGRTELVERVLSELNKSNAYAYQNIRACQSEKTVETERGTVVFRGNQTKYSGLYLKKDGAEHCICTVLRKTIALATEKGDAYYLGKFNQINEDIRHYCEEFYLHLQKRELL